MLGVMTIGNATLIALDDTPVLTTDPWVGDEDEAYFGSWTLSHEIPTEQKELIQRSAYHWYSHAHPDHLNPHSIERYPSTEVLLPDHVGSRIRTGLQARGFNVTVLPERKWVDLSKSIKVMCISDFAQNAVLLIDVNGRLFLDLNDAGLKACKRFIGRIAATYGDVYLLKLSGYGDADMINIFNEQGERIKPDAHRNLKVGNQLSSFAKKLGANHVVPFSSFHKYQRGDSVWADQYTTPLVAYASGFDHQIAELLPPFVRIDCTSDDVIEILPPPLESVIKRPEEFGDVWSDDLEKDDKAIIDKYFQEKELIRKFYGFLNFKVGNTRHTLKLAGPARKGITFEAPRSSLMAAVQHEIFDDLLIGNFMKTTFHNVSSLYAPNFNYVVAKYADNGRAQSKSQVESYLRAYAARAPGEWLMQSILEKGAQTFRTYVRTDNRFYALGRSIYRSIR